MKKLFCLAAVLASFVTVSTPSFANDDATIDDGVMLSSPEASHGNDDWNRDRDWRRPHRGSFVCWARNIRGQTFTSHGNWRTPREWVARQALQECRSRSFIFGRTCRLVGCRDSGGWDHGDRDNGGHGRR